MRALLDYLESGDIAIFPTDTLYAIGCLFDKPQAIKKLYKIRKTPETKPSILLTANFNQALSYGEFGEGAKKIADAFWPGPLTLIVKAAGMVPKSIQGERNTIALRVPNQPPINSLINKLGVPILAPSANIHGKPAPTVYNEIDKELLALVDYAIDISNLKKARNMTEKPSTIIDMTNDSIEIRR